MTKWHLYEHLICDRCGEEFGSSRIDAKYCSPSCRQAAYRERQKLKAAELAYQLLLEEEKRIGAAGWLADLLTDHKRPFHKLAIHFYAQHGRQATADMIRAAYFVSQLHDPDLDPKWAHYAATNQEPTP